MSRNIAILLAGGTGSRAGFDRPKQFLELSGRMVIEYSLMAFEQSPLIDEIAIVVNPKYNELIDNMVQCNNWQKVKRILPGGAERYDSSLSAIHAYENEDVNLIFHDAARPLLPQEVIRSVCQALKTYDAVGVGIASVDTVMEVREERMIHVPVRAHMQRMQTPQAFKIGTITEAYRKALADPAFQATDDCGVVLKYMPDTPIHVVEGDECLMKLTYADDLDHLERLVREKGPDVSEHHVHRYLPKADNSTPEGRLRYLKEYHKQHLREMQLAEWDILCHVARICERHDIPYWLDGGTLLGAVRHGGFIPWNDNVEICMPYELFKRFVEVAQKELPDHLFVQTPKTEPLISQFMCKVRDLNTYVVEPHDDFTKPYAKGLYINIYPMKVYPSFPRKMSEVLARNYAHAYTMLHIPHMYSMKAVARLLYYGTLRATIGAVWHIASFFTPKNKYYGHLLSQNHDGKRHRYDSIFPLTSLEFEGESFSVPAHSEVYLRDLFDEYSELPPEDMREGDAVFYTDRLV